MTQTTPAPVTDRPDDRTFRRLAHTSLTVSLLGLAVAVAIGVAIGVFSLVQTSTDANMGLVPVILIGTPMLLPFGLSSLALLLRRSAPTAAMTLAAVATAFIVVGLLGVVAVFLPSLLG